MRCRSKEVSVPDLFQQEIEIWSWCAQHNIWLTGAHIHGVQNVETDKQSRRSHSQLEQDLSSLP